MSHPPTADEDEPPLTGPMGHMVRGGEQPKVEHCPGCGSAICTTNAKPLDTRACRECGKSFGVLREFGAYTLLEKIGEGGTGAVYRAADKELVRTVALKLVIDDGTSSDVCVQRFEAEAATMASIQEDHIVRVYSTGNESGSFYIAMEFMPGGSLQDRLDDYGCIDEAHALDIAIQIARGLQAVFGAGLLHRDIKPSNILFSQGNIAKITDFGLALFSSEAAARAKDEVVGSPYYLPPERVQGRPEDIRSDIFSLGATLYHAMAGRPPYEAETPHLIALKRIQGPPISILTFAPGISSPTLFCLERMLAQNPDDRFQTYDQVIHHLQYALDHVSHKQIQAAQKSRVIGGEDEEQRLWAWCVLGVILLVALLFGAAILQKPEKPPHVAAGHPARGTTAAPPHRAAASFCDGRFDQEFSLFISGDFPNAAKMFLAAAKTETTQPAKDWATVLGGVSLIATGDALQARKAFQSITDYSSTVTDPEGRELASWFVNTRARFSGEIPPSFDFLKHLDQNPPDSLSLFIGGLFYLSSPDFAVSIGYSLLHEFAATPPPPGYEWIGELRNFAEIQVSRAQTLASQFSDVQTSDDQAHREKVIASMRSSGSFFARRVEAMMQGIASPQPSAQSSAPVRPKHGLQGDYFSNPTLEGKPVFSRYDGPLNIDWGIGRPDVTLPVDGFSARWTGQLEAKYSEVYHLTTIADDGIRVWLDGVLIIDDWHSHPLNVNQTDVPLLTGQRYNLIIEYFEDIGDAAVRLKWSSPSKENEVIPLENLYPPLPGLAIPKIDRHH